MPVYARRPLCSVCPLHGERAWPRGAQNGTMFGVSSLGTVSLEEAAQGARYAAVYQFYFHRDRGLNCAMMQRAKEPASR